MAGDLSAYSFLGVVTTGILPALLWLWFWLKEDPHPEPRKSLLVSFFLGMAIVPIVLALEFLWYRFALFSGIAREGEFTSIFLLLVWAFLEEGSKFTAAWWADLKRSVYDEPVDAMIYLITVALGFSALENVLFLLDVVGDGALEQAVTANMRFFGATLLHTVTAGVMGASVAFSFFHREKQWRNIIGGILLATLLHAIFNAAIINASSSATLFQTFFAVWTLIIILIFIFEKVKRLRS